MKTSKNIVKDIHVSSYGNVYRHIDMIFNVIYENFHIFVDLIADI